MSSDRHKQSHPDFQPTRSTSRRARMTDDDIPISHLQRRKIEGRVLLPFIRACRERFGDAATRDVVIGIIRELAVSDGAGWADTYGHDMAALKQVVEEVWAGGGSVELDVINQTGDRLDFNVTRCRYAEFWGGMGLADTGFLLHCNRDHAMVDGFNVDMELERTQTLMEGSSHCDFRFRARKPK
jgi:L-2-amino-thiazoline-4-carboxylic acid hydrolase